MQTVRSTRETLPVASPGMWIHLQSSSLCMSEICPSCLLLDSKVIYSSITKNPRIINESPYTQSKSLQAQLQVFVSSERFWFHSHLLVTESWFQWLEGSSLARDAKLGAHTHTPWSYLSGHTAGPNYLQMNIMSAPGMHQQCSCFEWSAQQGKLTNTMCTSLFRYYCETSVSVTPNFHGV